MNDLDHLLKLASASDLRTFSKDYAHKNEGFRQELLTFLDSKYVNKNEKTIEDYCRQMRGSFGFTQKIGDRWHSFIVPDWYLITSRANSILKEGDKLLAIGNANAAASIAVEFFVALQDTYDEDCLSDDYDGDIACEIGNSCEQAEQLLLKSIKHSSMSKDVVQDLTKKLNDISKTSFSHDLNNYFIFDFDHMFLQVSQTTMSDDEQLNMFDTQIMQHAGQYDQFVYVERKVDMLRQLYRDADAQAELRKYKNLPEIRTLVVNDLISKKDFQTAVQLIHEGIDVARELGHWGTVRSWREKELEIYEKSGDQSRQIDMCSTLFVSERGSMTYYRKLKALIPANEWKDFLYQLLSKISNDGSGMFGQSVIADIYVAEKEVDKLYELIMSHGRPRLNSLNRYAKHTGENHAKQLLDAYEQLLKSEARINVNVKTYHRIAEAMSYMCQLHDGKQAAHQLAEFFRQEYRRRPKMMEEIKQF